jgi:putative FmdB family regulatory protein
MPIYEYRCASCGHQQEFLQKVSDPPVTVCTQCGKPAFNKMVTAAGFQLKGSGWYATDFKNSGARAKPSEATKADAKAESTGDAKGEAKSEAKSDGKSEGKSDSAAAVKSETKAAGESKSEGASKDAAPPA